MNLASTITAVKCPVCGTLCADPPLYRYTASEAATHFCPITRNATRHHRLKASITKLWSGDECNILQCKECQFAFAYPFVGGDEEFYSILHEQQGYPTWRWDYDLAIREALSPFEKGQILDIGAGAGMFLRGLEPQWKRYAVEGSELTREPLKAAGIHVFPDLSAIPQSEFGTFQVVTLFQVLEHIADFRSVLAQCRQLLCAGGRLFISVPSGEAMIRQEKLTGCPDMPPNHVNKWTPDSLSRVLHDANFYPQPAIFESPSWDNLKLSLHLRVMTKATNQRSLAAQVYRISNKRLRALLLSTLGLPALIKLLPYVQQLRQGGSFVIMGTAR
ncbi:class I SAM-dependent methyltransferase [Fortiea contorta]|uniref:class I SAM-dependent methyltransferase n=1 Tax=Fortiea contorta TaxID=1892405 RepID=UPI00034BDB81|nr:class I SAM-dependent methyltransferase [Fortiea contorta]